MTVSTGSGGGGYLSPEGEWLGDHVEYVVTVETAGFDPLEYTTQDFNDDCLEFLFNATVVPSREILTMAQCDPNF